MKAIWDDEDRLYDYVKRIPYHCSPDGDLGTALAVIVDHHGMDVDTMHRVLSALRPDVARQLVEATARAAELNGFSGDQRMKRKVCG